ncbi:MAG: ribosomal protein S18-alanine N-acetyltransferase [Lachnospiraceae bacterium]|nr:ribosomal protein S18-alanine N-acetyltransferase [Lachnospiraceae bacterium]
MIELRRMQIADCERVAEIAKQTLPESWSYQEICKVLQYEYNVYYVAWDTITDNIIGFAGIMVIAEDAELLNIAIDPLCQHNKIGSALMEQMIQEAWGHKANRMLLEVRAGNLNAQRLYAKYHFTVLDVRKKYYNNPTEDALVMSLERAV